MGQLSGQPLGGDFEGLVKGARQVKDFLSNGCGAPLGAGSGLHGQLQCDSAFAEQQRDVLWYEFAVLLGAEQFCVVHIL